MVFKNKKLKEKPKNMCDFCEETGFLCRCVHEGTDLDVVFEEDTSELSFLVKNKGEIIMSEAFKLKFCPICGKELNKN